MKKISFGLLAVAILFSVCLPVSAHPGRTDSQGGHYDRSTGEYHFHHGYPAHQHVDGICPYDFDDKTGATSGAPTGNPSNGIASGEKTDPTGNNGKPWIILMKGVFIVFAGILAFGAICGVAEKFKDRKQRKKLLPIYEGKSISALAGVPDWAEVDKAGYPHTKGVSGRPQDYFLVYVTKTGKVYHAVSCRHLHKPVRSMNICEAKAHGLSPCSACKPCAEIPAWATEYRKLDILRNRYKIHMAP